MSEVESIKRIAIENYNLGIKRSMDVINSNIKDGPLEGDGTDETAQRNGLILAFNLLVDLLEED